MAVMSSKIDQLLVEESVVDSIKTEQQKVEFSLLFY